LVTKVATEPIIFVNGEYVPQSQARISVLDHAVLYGDGVFETAVAWNGVVHELDAHLARLFRSLGAIRLESPHSRAELVDIVCETVRRNDLRNAYIKLIITRGDNGKPLLDPTGCRPGVICLVQPYMYMASAERVRDGLRVKTVAVRRTPAQVVDPHVKSLNYLNLVLARLEAEAAQADEALLLDIDGHVCEAPGYNIFAVAGATLRTPARDILAGITRATVMQLAASDGFDVRAETVELYDLYTADEVFMCSTAGGLLAVVELDGRKIGDAKPGPIFTRLRDQYQERLADAQYGTAIEY
jgi:branched-chain amino acid aminotransferase